MINKNIYKILRSEVSQLNSSALCYFNITSNITFSNFEFEEENIDLVKNLLYSKINVSFNIQCPVDSYCGKKFGSSRFITFKSFKFASMTKSVFNTSPGNIINIYSLKYEYEDCDISPSDIGIEVIVSENITECTEKIKSDCDNICNTSPIANYKLGYIESKINVEAIYEINGYINPIPSNIKSGSDNWSFNSINNNRNIKEIKHFFTQRFGRFIDGANIHYAAELDLTPTLKLKIRSQNRPSINDTVLDTTPLSNIINCFINKNKVDFSKLQITKSNLASDSSDLYSEIINSEILINKVSEEIEKNQSFQEAITKSIKNQIEKNLSEWRSKIRTWSPDSPALMQSSLSGPGNQGPSTNNMILNGFTPYSLNQNKKFPYQIKSNININILYNIKMRVGGIYEPCCIASLIYNKNYSKIESQNTITIEIL